MDRVFAYDGEVPQASDILSSNLFAMLEDAYQNRAILGTTTVVAGLACLATTPNSLSVTVGQGSIFALDATDATAYGDLGINSAQVVKQGILATAQTLTLTAPTTSGYSQVYLIEAALVDADTGLSVLNYYNSSNPAAPFQGPANSGQPNYTVRSCKCVITLKAGLAAPTGSQTTPALDAGNVGLYTITLTNGQLTIAQNQITTLATIPTFPTLPSVPAGVQGGTWVYVGTDTGTANNYAISFGANQPIPAAYTAGMGIKFRAANACTGASVINVNGLGNVTIRRASGVALATGDISAGQIVELTYDGTYFQMVNYIGSGANTNTATYVGIPYVADSSATPNVITATFSPAITAGQQVAGLTVEVKLANTITGACTINVNGLGAKNVLTGDLANPPNGLFVAGEVLLLVYDGTQYQVVNTTSQIYRKPTANVTIYVNASTGSDSLYDGTSATVTGIGTAGPFKTIQQAINTAWGYAPSQFTITIQVAAGTYNEAPATPSTAGPNTVINGASQGTVLVNGGSLSECFVLQGPNTMTIQNLTATFAGRQGGGGAFSAISGAVLNCINVEASNCFIGFFTSYGATLYTHSHAFNGNVDFPYYSEFAGSIVLEPGTITNSTMTVQAFAEVIYGGYILVSSTNPPSWTAPGAVTGQKFNASYNGIIWTPGLGVNYFPGTAAGITSIGGAYV
jgi:hypothetical protein